MPRLGATRDRVGALDRPAGGGAPWRVRAVVTAAAVAAFAAGAWAALDPGRAGLALLLVAAGLVVAGAAWLDAGPRISKEIAVVATLGAVAAAGRVLFATVPGVQPVTVIVLAAGAALGPRAGIGVGATAALASNFFLGQGIWTPWQMLAWGACGGLGGLVPRLLGRRLSFAAVAAVAGFGFSFLMDVWQWLSFYPHTWEAFSVQIARGVPFDLAHAIGNVVIALAVGPELLRVLGRYGRRLRTEIAWN